MLSAVDQSRASFRTDDQVDFQDIQEQISEYEKAYKDRFL